MHKKGFTLLELVISLGIFMIFTTAVISSFLSLTASTTRANLNREQVSEANQIFEYIQSIAKENALDYSFLETAQQTNNSQTYAFISPDRLTRFLIRSQCPTSANSPEEFCKVESSTSNRSNISQEFILDGSLWTPLHSENLRITKFNLESFPERSPFTTDQIIESQNQFQPITHITLNLSRNKTDNYQEALSRSNPITLQTSISSRSYNN